MDTVWTPHRDEFIKNLESEIDLNKIDFIVAQHEYRQQCRRMLLLE
jgi:Uncharacterized flavoproteins